MERCCKTLHELCDDLGVTRRAVQGYEKAGLVSATAKINMGICYMMRGLKSGLHRLSCISNWDLQLKKYRGLLMLR